MLYTPLHHNLLIHVADPSKSKEIYTPDSLTNTGCLAMGKVVSASALHQDLLGKFVEYDPALTTSPRSVLQDLRDPRYLIVIDVMQARSTIEFPSEAEEPVLRMVGGTDTARMV